MSWWRRFAKREEMEQHLDAELRFHFDGLVADNLRAGMREPEARRSARLKFGGLEQVKEECRDARGVIWANDLIQDLRFAFRTLRKTPVFTITVIGTLALGIGGNTAMFTLIRATVLKPLNYHDPGRLVYLSVENAGRDQLDNPFTLIRFEAMRKSAHSFSGLGAFGPPENLILSGSGEPEALHGARVSANFLEILGIKPSQGRTFLLEEDAPGGPPVAMISTDLWKRRFGGDPRVVGHTATLDSTLYTIIGVLPAGFEFPFADVDVWVTKPSEWSALPSRYWRTVTLLNGFARLKPEVGLEQARAEMQVLNQQYLLEKPDFGVEPGNTLKVVWLKDRLLANIRPTLWMLFGAVAFVLLVACANVASLLFARATSRSRELAMRASLGAGRSRLIRQLLTESLMLAVAGGTLGILLAQVCLRVITSANVLSLPMRVKPLYLPGAHEVHIDGTVILFSVAASIATVALYGLFPAFRISRLDLTADLREVGVAAGLGSRRRGALGFVPLNLLVVGQVALSIVLLTGAALLMKSFARVRSVNPGFEPANLLTMKIALPPARYNTDTKKGKFFRELLPNLEGLSGVTAAAISLSIPTTAWTRTDITGVEGKPPLDPNQEASYAVLQSVTAGYFRTLAIPLKRGRQFTEHDNNPGAPPVVIVNESLARRLWPGYPLGEDPIGRHIKEAFDKAVGWMEVVGIVGDTHEGGLAYDASVPEFYLPYTVHPPQRAFLIARTQGDPLRLANAIRGSVLRVDSDQPVTDVRTMEAVLDAPLGQRRLTMLLLGSFAAVAILLAVMGLYGVITYSVEQRTQELGIRYALGAQRSDVRRLVAGHGLRLAVIGIAIGLGGALALTRILTSQLFHTSASDPAVFGGIAVLFVIVVLLASSVPARRATRINPMEALRWE